MGNPCGGRWGRRAGSVPRAPARSLGSHALQAVTDTDIVPMLDEQDKLPNPQTDGREQADAPQRAGCPSEPQGPPVFLSEMPEAHDGHASAGSWPGVSH